MQDLSSGQKNLVKINAVELSTMTFEDLMDFVGAEQELEMAA